MNVTLQSAKFLGAGIGTVGLIGVGIGIGNCIMRRSFSSGIFPKDVPNFKQLVHPNDAVKGVAFCGEFWGWV